MPQKYFANFDHGLCDEDLAGARRAFSLQKSRCVNQDKRDANGDPVRVVMTFDEWLNIWISSGKYHLRGKNVDSFVMARKNDIGNYTKDNVEIIKHTENLTFAHGAGKSHLFRAHETHPSYGKRGADCQSTCFKGSVIATNVSSGETIVMNGRHDIVYNGFDAGHVYKCIAGKYSKTNVYHGHTFKRIPITSL